MATLWQLALSGKQMLSLDTHILIFALTDTLRKSERTLLVAHPWSIASIVLWEIAKLAQLGRINLDLSDPVVETVLSTIHVWPLDLEIARKSTELDFRADPADELIAATSIVHQVPLMTRDKQIRKSKIVPFV